MYIRPSFCTLAMMFLVFTAVGGKSAHSQEKRGPSTAEERSKAVQFARDLESDPLGPNAKEERSWITVWLIQIPDITVKFCTSLLGPRSDPENIHWSAVSTQMLYSGAAFMIENPKKKNDQQAVYLAGLDGALKSYEAILKKEPQARWPFVDELIEKRDQGKLGEYVKQSMTKCK
jgi:hypothetical protein